MPHNITKDMLATALQRLEAIAAGEPEPIDEQQKGDEQLRDEQLRERAMEVAEAALQALAICVKYSLGSSGESSIEGLGTLLLRDERIEFVPESDVLQYALLKQQDQASLQQALRDAFLVNLNLAYELLPSMDLREDSTASETLELTPEERVLQSIFGSTGSNRFDRAVSQVISSIIRDLRAAGVDVELAADVAAADVAGTDVGTARESLSTRQWSRGYRRGRRPWQREGEAYMEQGATHRGADVEVGKVYQGTVTRVKSFGAFVELSPGIEGLIHVSEISEDRVADAGDVLKAGDFIMVRVLSVDGSKIRLSRKGLTTQPRQAMDIGEIAAEAAADVDIDPLSESREG
jgi:predicted RNA-binding protein with RPS1 domain